MARASFFGELMNEVKAPALSPKLLRGAEFERVIHSAIIPPGISLQSVMRPDYWAHCSDRLKPYDKVECRAQDNKWIATLMVAGIGVHSASMWVENYVDLSAQGGLAAEDAGYTVSFASRQRWRVIRKSDNSVVSKDHATEDDAKRWASENLSIEA
jgi:hypothetical protein